VFSKGNPTGISDVPGSKGTFAGEIHQSDIADVHYGKGRNTDDITLGDGKGSKNIGNVESVGGKMTEEAFSGNYEGARKESTTFTNKSEHKGGRGTRHTGGVSNAERHAEAAAEKEDSQPDTQPRRSARLQNKSNGPEDVPAKDTASTTNIGTEQDPGRLAEQKFAARNAGEIANASRIGAQGGGTNNPYGPLSE
jgi:hypothetical protein